MKIQKNRVQTGAAKKNSLPHYALVLLAAASIAAAAFILGSSALMAAPGDKDDPLATVNYVQGKAQFNRVQLAAGQSIRLRENCELILVTPADTVVPVSEFDPLKDELIDLTEGSREASRQLTAFHHYINASTHDIFIRCDSNVTLLLRGDWK